MAPLMICCHLPVMFADWGKMVGNRKLILTDLHQETLAVQTAPPQNKCIPVRAVSDLVFAPSYSLLWFLLGQHIHAQMAQCQYFSSCKRYSKQRWQRKNDVDHLCIYEKNCLSNWLRVREKTTNDSTHGTEIAMAGRQQLRAFYVLYVKLRAVPSAHAQLSQSCEVHHTFYHDTDR